MIEYSVMLERHKGSSRPDVCVFSDYDRETAIAEMGAYCKENGFTVYDHDGRFTVADIVLVAREPVVGAQVISRTPYIEIIARIAVHTWKKGNDMAKYCRYCSWFVTGNGDYCTLKEKELSSTYAKRTNQCEDFSLNLIDAYGENLNGYRPRKPKRKDGQQIRMEDL